LTFLRQKMGVIDNEVQRLHDIVSKLEQRVEKLEERRSGETKPTDGVRMILMGPPGAGTLSPTYSGRSRVPIEAPERLARGQFG
jgi:hypothetical protein